MHCEPSSPGLALLNHVGLIGFGEVGRIFAGDLLQAGVQRITAFDLLPGRAGAPATACASPAAASGGAALVIIAVTAGSALAAARSLDGALAHGPYVMDVNSTAPATKRAAAAMIEASGGRYVEAAIMTSVPGKGLASPMLLGGPHAAAFLNDAAGLGLSAQIYADTVGPASSVKMCRSVMVKGMEALLTECLLAARHYGVEADVMASLTDTIPFADWPAQAQYMIGRALLHGRRRAEEMREVARTVQDAGLTPLLATAIAERQDWAADQGARIGRAALAAPLATLLDTVARQ